MVIGLKVLDPRLKYGRDPMSCWILTSPFAGSLRKMPNLITPTLRNRPRPLPSPQLLPRRARSGTKRNVEVSRSPNTRRKISMRGAPRLVSPPPPFPRFSDIPSTCRTSFRVPGSILSVRMIESPFSSSNVLSNHPLFPPITHKASMDGHCCFLQVGAWPSFLLFCIREPDSLANANG